MRSVLWFGMACVLAPLAARADVTYTPVLHSQLQAVNDLGYSTWTVAHPTSSPYPVALVGIVINNPADMLDYGLSAAKPQWQTYIQAVNPNDYGISFANWSDFGGTALFMLKNSFKANQQYSDSEWTSETQRVGFPWTKAGTQTQLQYGDVVLVQAKSPGLFYNGKFNINEQHMKSSDYDFSIQVLAKAAVPTAADIALSDLKDAGNAWIFDASRATGCERYQGSLVHLDNLTIADASRWTLNNAAAPVTVRQESLNVTRTFDLILGLDPALALVDAKSLETTPFSLTAILDQESSDPTGDYRLWVTDASGLTVVPEPGSIVLLASGCLAIFALRRRKQCVR